MSNRVFVTRRIVGFRAFGWQFDYRPDGWLPFSIRYGKREWKVLRLGRLGCMTAGRVTSLPSISASSVRTDLGEQP